MLFGNDLFGITSVEGWELKLHNDADDPVADIAAVVRPGVLGIDKVWPSRVPDFPDGKAERHSPRRRFRAGG